MAAVNRQVVEEDRASGLDLRRDRRALVHEFGPQAVDEAQRIARVAVMKQRGFVRAGNQPQAAIGGGGVIEGDPDRNLVAAMPVGPVLMPRAGKAGGGVL